MLLSFVSYNINLSIGKYNRGKRVDGVWVFGGVERGTGRCFLEVVQIALQPLC
jgi:hypothetical protein